MKNFDDFRTNGAIYTPAVSPAFVKPLSLEKHADLAVDMNWLKKDSPWHYKWSLYSAGHAFLDPAESDIRESFIQSRDRDDTLLIGDSGGFQIATGVLKFDWANEENITDLNLTVNQQRMKLLRWLEHTADLATTLDWPTWMFDDSGKIFGRGKKTALKSPEHALEGTVRNLKFFCNNRQNKDTRFLNVLQGRNEEECLHWYNTVKHFDFEGWSFAGPTRLKLGDSFERLLRMRDDHAFENGRDWIHILGVSKISAGMALTTLQKALRKYVNPKMQISYDSASPFLMAAFGSTYYGYIMSKDKLSMKAGKSPKGDELIGYDGLWHINNPLREKYKIKDFVDIKAKHTWTLRGYLYQMYSNTYQICEALRDSTNTLLIPGNNFNNMIPEDILKLEWLFDSIFKSEEPMKLVNQYKNTLNRAISNDKGSFQGDFLIKQDRGMFNLLGENSDEADIKQIQDNNYDIDGLLEKILTNVDGE